MSGADPLRTPTGPDLDGWIRLGNADLASERSRTDLAEFFDGAGPDLETVLNPGLAPLGFVTDVIDYVQGRVMDRVSGLTLIRGPSGEGKSTALLQCAVQIARCGDVAVFLREHDNSPLPRDGIDDLLARGDSALFIADSAESLIGDVGRLTGEYRRPTGAAVHLLLAARSSDWTKAWRDLKLPRDPVSSWQGSSFAIRKVDLGNPVEEQDARTIAQNWAALGGLKSERLGVKSEDNLTQWLQKASRFQATGSGALFGALLQVRLGESGLRSRIATVLNGLRQTTLPSGRTLAEVLLAVATASCASIDGVPREIVARMAGIERARMRSTVEIPLGREALAGSSSAALHVRHQQIAVETLRLALDEADDDLITATRALVEATVAEGEATFYASGYGHLIDIGRRLVDPKTSVSSDLDRHDLVDVAVEACRTAVQVNPEALTWRQSLSYVLRKHGRAEQAVEFWRYTLPEIDQPSSWRDGETVFRGAWAEAATALGVADYYESAMLLATVSVSDRIRAPLDTRRVVQAISTIGMQAAKIYQRRPDARLVKLVSSLAGVEIRRYPDGPPVGESHSVENCELIGTVPDRKVDPEQVAASVIDYVSQLQLSSGTEWIAEVLDPLDLHLQGFVRFLLGNGND